MTRFWYFALLGFFVAVTGCRGVPPAQDDGPETSMQLMQVGEAHVLKGRVVHAPGTVALLDRHGMVEAGFSRRDQVQSPTKGTMYTVADCRRQSQGIVVDLPLPASETPVAVARAPLGGINEVTVVVVTEAVPGDYPLDAQLAPQRLVIFDESETVTSLALDGESLPCTLIVDDIAAPPWNEVVLLWASVGAGYSMGVTVFAVH